MCFYFDAAFYHRTEITIPASCPAERRVGLKSFLKAICHPLSHTADQTWGPALVSTPSKRYQGPVFLFISPSIIMQAKEGNRPRGYAAGRHTEPQQESCLRQGSRPFLMVNGASVCSQQFSKVPCPAGNGSDWVTLDLMGDLVQVSTSRVEASLRKHKDEERVGHLCCSGYAPHVTSVYTIHQFGYEY